MKRPALQLLLLLSISLGSCTKEQYKGDHLAEGKQVIVKKKTVSYHAKEANKVIEENIENKQKNIKHREKRRDAQNEYLTSLNENTSKVKKSKKRVVYDFY